MRDAVAAGQNHTRVLEGPGTPTAWIPVELLDAGDTSRLAGTDDGYAGELARFAGEPPPIIVHRRSMRVVDGRHRLRAAIIRGEREIEATTGWLELADRLKGRESRSA